MGNRRERWLHARISEDLEEALKREARRRRSPVSLVVRDVLEAALDLVEGIVGDSLHVARRSQRLANQVTRASRFAAQGDIDDDIYGWQELILNRPAECGRCDAALTAGTTAYRGLRDQLGGPLVFLCTYCVRRLRQPAEERRDDKEVR